MSHLRQSYHLHETVGRAAARFPVAAMVVDLLEVPIFVCTSERRILLANKAALDLVASGDIILHSGVLSTPDPTTEARLCAATDAAAKAATGVGVADARVICMIRGRRTGVPHCFRAFALAEKHPLRAEAGSRGIIALIGISGQSESARSVPVFVEMFGLRMAEAKLAALLVDGASLAVAASTMRITINTARSYLQLIFDRTRTHRQAELVSMLRSVMSIPLS